MGNCPSGCELAVGQLDDQDSDREQIGEIKMYFEEHETEFEKQLGKVEDARNPPAEPYVLEGSPGQWDIDTFAHDLPPRPVVDLLVANYFGASSLIRRMLTYSSINFMADTF
jgi:hypothetical protein